MPDILTGTNTGPSAYGPATGKKIRFSGTAVAYVQKVKGRWVYVAEWLLHDEFSLISQLGFTNISAIPHPPLGNKLHDCSVNEPGFGWRAPGEDPPVHVSEHGFLHFLKYSRRAQIRTTERVHIIRVHLKFDFQV